MRRLTVGCDSELLQLLLAGCSLSAKAAISDSIEMFFIRARCRRHLGDVSPEIFEMARREKSNGHVDTV